MKLKILKFLNSTTLFVRVASIMLTSIILISLIISFITIRISKNIITTEFSRSNYIILNQIAENFDELNSKIITAMNIVAESTDFENFLTKYNMSPNEYHKTLYNMHEELGSYFSSQDSTGITLCIAGFNGESYVQNSDSILLSTEDLLNSSITKSALEKENQVFYQYYDGRFTKNTRNSGGLVAIKALHNKYTHDIYGFVYAFISQEYFRKYYLPFTETGYNIYIINSDGTIVSSNLSHKINTNDSALYMISQNIICNKLDYINTQLNSSDVTILSKYLPTYNFNIIGIIDKNVLLRESYKTWQIMILSLLIASIFIIIVFFIIRKITNPIITLADTMPKIISGNFNNHISIRGSIEVRKLCSAFNYMLDGLNRYVNNELKIQREKRKAEIDSLQMQINPHFIYNTLSSIKWLVWQEDKTKVSQTIDAFICLLRNTISNKNEMIPISEEIENLKNYVLIKHVRYGDKINVSFFIMPECEKYIIPKLILQPFIENAFFHAFNNKDSGTIRVFVNKNNENLICEIIDNGTGITNENLDNIYKMHNNKKNNFTSIGIKNVNDRIKLIFGNSYGVSIKSEFDKGTIVKLVIPAITECSKFDL